MIEVGEYAKIKEWNVIGKILKVTPRKVYIDNLGFSLTREQIAKHSKNIIDLIEVGDYVNGYRILEKTKIKNNEMQICILKDNNCSNWRTINNMTLKSIVTREQFAQAEYKVEEDK